LEPGSEQNKEDDFWGFGVSKKKKKKKKTQMFEPEPEAEKEENFRSIWSTSKPEAATDPKPDPLEKVEREEGVGAAPAVADDWSVCESDGKETRPKASCNLRASGSMYLRMGGKYVINVRILYVSSLGSSLRRGARI